MSSVYEYRISRTDTKFTEADVSKLQAEADAMAAEGWRMVSAFPDAFGGSTMHVVTVWEREKKSP